MNKMMIIIYILLGVLLVWTLGSYISISKLEEPKYIVLQKQKGYEIREYESYIIAEVEVTGPQREAVNKGFRLIADYIFGNNTSTSKIAMTAPVIDEVQEVDYEKIAMTVPVIDEELSDNIHKVSFVLPSLYTLETIPKPNNTKVKLRTVESRKVAALRFTWYATESRVEKNKSKLVQLLEGNEVVTTGNLQLAQYNPPLSAPFTRRNEILVTIEN